MSPIGDEAASALPDEELLRARAYALLARLLARPPGTDLLEAVAAIGAPADGPPGEAFAALSDAARAADPRAVEEEHTALFIGVGGGELTPYASYYRTGFLNEKPLADLRADMAALGIERADDVKEPEDHIAALCEMMAGLITGAFGEPLDLAGQKAFFERHIGPWAARFFADLEGAAGARFYRAVGALGGRFIEVEVQAFALAA